jgi:hypothetical protein
LVELVIAGSQRYIACESKETEFADRNPFGLDWRIFRHCKEMLFCPV